MTILEDVVKTDSGGNNNTTFASHDSAINNANHHSLAPSFNLQPIIIEPTVEIEFDGNYQVGVVQIYKQVHTNHYEKLETLEKIGKYQAQIYNHFLRTQPHHHIFFEGLQENFPRCDTYDFSNYCYVEMQQWPELWNVTTREGCAEYIRKQFADYDLHKPPTETQLLYLGALGGARIFAICFADVSLHRTTDEEFRIKLNEVQNKPHSHLTPAEVMQRTYPARERRALKEIKSFLDLNPGAKVDLVYGSWHQFTHPTKKVFSEAPLMIAYDWPDLSDHLGWPPRKRLFNSLATRNTMEQQRSNLAA